MEDRNAPVPVFEVVSVPVAALEVDSVAVVADAEPKGLVDSGAAFVARPEAQLEECDGIDQELGWPVSWTEPANVAPAAAAAADQEA